MLAIALGLASSLFWGLADFGGGLQSRRFPVIAVLLVSQAVGLAGIAVIVALSGEPAPALADLWPAAAGGAGGLLALSAFYRALAIGTVSIVAAGVGVVLASREAPHDDDARARAGRASIALALVAALGFGAFFVGMDRAASADILWALLAARIAGNLGLLGFVLVARPRLHVPPAALP